MQRASFSCAIWSVVFPALTFGCTQETIVTRGHAAGPPPAPKYGGCVQSRDAEIDGKHSRPAAECLAPEAFGETGCAYAVNYETDDPDYVVVVTYRRTPLYDMTCADWIAEGRPEP